MPLLVASSISIRLGHRPVLKDIDLHVDAGEVVTVAGPPSSGKTTLANVLAGVFQPTAGHVTFNGHPLRHLSPHSVSALGLAFAHARCHPFLELAVRDNVLVGAHLRDAPTALDIPSAIRAARRALDIVHLPDRFNQRARHLSRVESRLLLLARAIVSSPLLLIADDMLSDLCSDEANIVLGALESIRDEGIAILLVDRYLHHAARISDRVVLLRDGRIVAEGSPADVSRDFPSIASPLLA